MKTDNTRNIAAESLNLPLGWHVDTYPGGNFTFERYDAHGCIAEIHNTRNPHQTAQRLLEGYARAEIEAERISCGEIAELEDLDPYIDPADTLLLEWAGVPETV